MKKDSLIRTIYLYSFSLVGLVLMVVGGVGLVDLGMKAFIFTKAEPETVSQPSMIYIRPNESIEEESFVEAILKCREECELNQVQKAQMADWLADYAKWKDYQDNTDYRTQKQHQQASQALAFIVIGLPLYLYHWSVIRKDLKVKKA